MAVADDDLFDVLNFANIPDITDTLVQPDQQEAPATYANQANAWIFHKIGLYFASESDDSFKVYTRTPAYHTFADIFAKQRRGLVSGLMVVSLTKGGEAEMRKYAQQERFRKATKVPSKHLGLRPQPETRSKRKYWDQLVQIPSSTHLENQHCLKVFYIGTPWRNCPADSKPPFNLWRYGVEVVDQDGKATPNSPMAFLEKWSVHLILPCNPARILPQKRMASECIKIKEPGTKPCVHAEAAVLHEPVESMAGAAGAGALGKLRKSQRVHDCIDSGFTTEQVGPRSTEATSLAEIHRKLDSLKDAVTSLDAKFDAKFEGVLQLLQKISSAK